MKHIRLIVAAFILFFAAPAAHAQEAPILVSLPDTSGLQVGDTLQVALTVEGKIPPETVFSFQGGIVFDGVVRLTGHWTNGELLQENAVVIVNSEEADSVGIAVAAPQGVLQGSGTLLYLEAVIIEEGSTPLTFTDFMFNEGTPAADTLNGSVTVGAQDENHPPQVVDPVEDQRLEEGASVSFDLNGVFEDPDGDPLSFSAASSNAEVVEVRLTGADLAIETRTAGAAEIIIAAHDGLGLSAADTFAVAVNEGEPPPPSEARLVFNEVLYDPPDGLAGDANGDGTADASADEFVAIANVSGETIDLTGYTLSDAEAVRHTVDGGTTLAPEEALIVFGGGTPTGIPAEVVQTASTGALDLSNESEIITLRDAGGAVVAVVTHEASPPAAPARVSSTSGRIRMPHVEDQSVARDPDLTGDFVPHTQIDGDGDGDPDGVAFSPGVSNTDASSSLPLVKFSGAPIASIVGSEVVLQWTTLIETNSDGFQVQKKRAGAPSFEDVTGGFIESKAPGGTAQEAIQYSFSIKDLEPGRYVLRLKQLSQSGEATYSETVEVEVETDPLRFRLTAAYPNPFSWATKINLVVPEAQHVRAEVYNVLGQQVKIIYDDRVRGEDTIILYGSDLSNGLYLIRVTGETFQEVRRVTLVK